MGDAQKIEIGPQPGPQTLALQSPADILFFGGEAGGGKSYFLLLDPLRYLEVPNFGPVWFRKSYPEIMNQGGLWDTSQEIFPLLGGRSVKDPPRWRFPNYPGFKGQFSHLQYDSDVYRWQGAQLPWIGFDEVTHFSERQFFYMLSRNRSATGVPACIRATCNPDPDSWVADFIAWWIDQDEDSPTFGLPIPERNGVLRWFARVGDEIKWADTPQELIEKYHTEKGPIIPKSVTFIRSRLSDNPILETKDPGYRANLLALSRVDRMRLLGGNWKVRAQAGTLFRKHWFPIVDAAPPCHTFIRYWDRAATEKTDKNDPDYTVGLKLGRDSYGVTYALDMVRIQKTPLTVLQTVKNSATQDGVNVNIGIEQDPGSAGKAEAAYYTRQLVGFQVKCYLATKDKVTRAKPASAQAEAGNIKLVRGPWNKAFLDELEAFPTDGVHDDIVDALSGGFNALNSLRSNPRITSL